MRIQEISCSAEDKAILIADDDKFNQDVIANDASRSTSQR